MEKETEVEALRSQIRKQIKEGIESKYGSISSLCKLHARLDKGNLSRFLRGVQGRGVNFENLTKLFYLLELEIVEKRKTRKKKQKKEIKAPLATIQEAIETAKYEESLSPEMVKAVLKNILFNSPGSIEVLKEVLKEEE